MLRGVVSDLRFGFRMLAKAPGFTAAAVLVLGLGVGANTAVFTILDTALLRPPAVGDPDRLVWIQSAFREGRSSGQISFPDYGELRDAAGVFDTLAAYRSAPMALSGEGAPERIRGVAATASYFDTLELTPALGRFFLPEEDRAAGAHPVAVISHRLWTRRYQADPGILGRPITLNGVAFTVTGIAPQGFSGIELGDRTDVWVPMMMHDQAVPAEAGSQAQRGHFNFSVLGRLAAGVSTDGAQAALQSIAARIEQEFPRTHAGVTMRVMPVRGGVSPSGRGDIVSIGALLTVVTGLVLLIACANVANLLLGRAAARRREMGVRTALGASRGRIVRQLLTESLLLSGLGAAAGLLISRWGLDLLLAIAGATEDLAGASQINTRVLVYTVGVALVTGVAFGLAPALNAARRDLLPALQQGAASAGPGRTRLQGLFVVAQVALSLVLLVSAGLFLRSVGKAAQVSAGFDKSNGLVVSFDPSLLLRGKEDREILSRSLLERARSMPGVRSASLAEVLPLSGIMVGNVVTVDGESEDDPPSRVYLNSVWPGYFATMGIPILRGRDFADADGPGAGRVVIVNETLAGQLWPGRDPIGQRLHLGSAEDVGEPWSEVVGVAQDNKYDELTEPPRPFLYLSHMQGTAIRTELTLIARTTGDPSKLAPALRAALQAVEADLPLFDMSTLEQFVDRRNDKQRGTSTMLAVFGALALMLACMGIYAVVAQSVLGRTREIGVRLAMGARPADILRLFVGQGLRLALIGVAIGLVLSAGLTRAVSHMLFGITPTDMATFAGVSILLAAVAGGASWLPARRALRVDPMTALRYE